MDSDMTRRRLLASAGVAASVGAASVAGATGTDSVEQPSNRSLDPPPVRWSRAYGPRRFNDARSLLQTDDGDLVGLGSAQKEQFGSGADWLFAVDGESGDGQWSHLIERTDETFPARDVVEADDGYLLLAAPRAGGGQFALRKVVDGERAWRRTYGPNRDSEEAQLLVFELVAVEDGYLVGGYVGQGADNAGPDAVDAVVLKVDNEGAEQWRHTFFGDRLALVQTITTDGDGYVASGVVQEPPESEDDRPPLKSQLFRFDERGSVTWQTELVQTTDSQPNRSSRVLDHGETEDGYLLVGTTGTRTERSPWVVATDSSGSVRTNRTVSASESGRRLTFSAVAGSDDTYYVTGTTRSEGGDGSSAWLGTFDSEAQQGWSVTPARKQTNAFLDVLTTSDGGVAVTGRTRTSDEAAETPGEAWLVKLGGDAVSTPTATPTATPSPTPTATPSPTPTATSTPEPTAARTDTETAAGADEADTATTADGGPGFGVGAALVGLGGAALLDRVGLVGETDDE